MAFYVGCINGGGIGLAPAKTGWQGDTNFSPPKPITEWDISRICQAGQEKDTPVMMRIKPANPASLTSSLLDIGVFLIKVPTVEDKATADAIIDASTILRWANAALAVPTTTAKERRVWSLKAVSWPTDQWQRRDGNACYEAQVGCTHYPLF